MSKTQRSHLTVNTESATRYGEKIINLFTWFHYGRLALKIYLWCLDNKELLSEIFHSILNSATL